MIKTNQYCNCSCRHHERGAFCFTWRSRKSLTNPGLLCHSLRSFFAMTLRVVTKNLQMVMVIIITQLLLTGCGFTTRNMRLLPPQLKQVYYQTEHPYDQFEVNFKKRLKAAGTNQLSEPKKSAPIINITISYNDNPTNSTSTTQARTYELKYSATINISDFYGSLLLDPQTVTVSRSISLQPNEVFEATPQTVITKQEMQQELSTKILNILSAPKTFQALKKLDV